MALQIWLNNFLDHNYVKMKDNIFNEFSPVDKQTWIDQAKKDLKGADFEEQLVATSMEGFPISPYYNVEDTLDTQWVKSYDNTSHPPASDSDTAARNWINAVEVGGVNERVLNEEIIYVLENGADGLVLSVSASMDFDQVFKGVLISYIAIWIRPSESEEIVAGMKAFEEWIGRQDLDPVELKGGVLWDGLAVGLAQPITLSEQIVRIYTMHQLFKSFPNFKSVCLDTSVYHNAGAHAAQELGYGLAALVEVWDGLTEKGVEAKDLFSDLFICAAVGSDYFMEIAKLKTFRITLHQLAQSYRVALKPQAVQLFVRTSRWSKSRAEPHNNLMRNTTEAMSAILGGCNALCVELHDADQPMSEVFSKRMARNISNIIKEESYFDKTMDPAAGSYFVENLIQSLYERAMELLKSVEAAGGWWQTYLHHEMQAEIKAVRNKKINHLVKSESVKGKTSKVPIINSMEEDYQLKPFSQFSPFEKTQ